MNVDWYFTLEGSQHGPVTEDDLKTMMSNGKVLPNDLVWREGMAEWQPVSQIPELMMQQPTGGPPSLSAASAPDFTSPYQTPASQLQQSHPVQTQFTAYATFWQRFAAAIIDSLLLMVGGAIVGGAFGVMMVTAGTDDVVVREAMGNLIGLIMGWLYYGLMESSSKQGTLGKMAMGIKVTDLNGQRIGFGKASGRHFGKIISSLILGIGYLMMLWTEKKQTLHDSMAACLVVKADNQ